MMCLDLLSQDDICEKVWVRKLSYNTAEIENLPVISRKYKYKDVIEFDPQTLNVTRIIRDGGYSSTEFIEYKGEFSEAKRQWKARGYQVEGLVPGMLAVSRKHYESDI